MEIIANERLSAVSMTPAINCSAVSTTTLTNLSPVSTIPAINLCHGFSVIGGVIDTGDKFITGFVDTAEQLSPMTTTMATQWPCPRETDLRIRPEVENLVSDSLSV